MPDELSAASLPWAGQWLGVEVAVSMWRPSRNSFISPQQLDCDLALEGAEQGIRKFAEYYGLIAGFGPPAWCVLSTTAGRA